MTIRGQCDIFVAEDTPAAGLFDVQFQFSTFTFNLIAGDLSFAQRIVDFVAETKGNPKYRDMQMGDGQSKYIPQKCVDLSLSLRGSNLVIEKDGEFDDSYVFRVGSPSGLRLLFELRGEQVESLLEGLQAIL